MIPTRGRKEGKLRLKLGGRGVPGGDVPGPRPRKSPEQPRERVQGRASRRPRAMPGSAQSWKVGACDHERWSQESSATCDGARVEGRWGTGETKPRPRRVRRASGNFGILSCPAGFKFCGLRSTKIYNYTPCTEIKILSNNSIICSSQRRSQSVQALRRLVRRRER